MAKTSSFGYTNTTASQTRHVPTYDLDILGSYALTSDMPTQVVLTNTTAPIDQEEIVKLRCRDIARVNTDLNLQYPSPVTAAEQYGIRTDTMLSTVDDTTGSRIDDPIVVQILVSHSKSGNITAQAVQTCVTRAVSLLMKNDGTWRFDDLMRSANRPTEN